MARASRTADTKPIENIGFALQIYFPASENLSERKWMS
jgi:hypothetical protein